MLCAVRAYSLAGGATAAASAAASAAAAAVQWPLYYEVSSGDPSTPAPREASLVILRSLNKKMVRDEL